MAAGHSQASCHRGGQRHPILPFLEVKVAPPPFLSIFSLSLWSFPSVLYHCHYFLSVPLFISSLVNPLTLFPFLSCLLASLSFSVFIPCFSLPSRLLPIPFTLLSLLFSLLFFKPFSLVFPFVLASLHKHYISHFSPSPSFHPSTSFTSILLFIFYCPFSSPLFISLSLFSFILSCTLLSFFPPISKQFWFTIYFLMHLRENMFLALISVNNKS